MALVEKLKNIIKKNPRIKEFLLRAHNSIQSIRNRPTKRFLVRKVWKDRAPFIAQVDAQPFSPESITTSTAPLGYCFFIPYLLKKPGLTSLYDLIKTRNYKHIALVGDSYYKPNLIDSLQKQFPTLVLHTFTQPGGMAQPFDPNFYQAVILTACHTNATPLIRRVLNTLQFPGDLIIENAQVYSMTPTRALESAKPIIVCAYPCAGTNRFIFGFEYLMKKLQWEEIAFSPFVRNVRYIHSLKHTRQEKADDTLVDEAFRWKIQTLDYFQWLNTHEYFSIAKLKELDCKFVVLMRDPRDIINSFYWHTINEVEDKKNHIYRIIDGYCRIDIEPNYAFNWPNVNKIMDNYLTAAQTDNCCVIRFEDLHKDEIGAFRKLMNQLQLLSSYLPITEEDLAHAAYLGSFAHQTKNKIKRGESNLKRLGGEHSGISCRKGIVGDWKSSFTKEAVEQFKSLTGDKLLQLGYETTMNWEL